MKEDVYWHGKIIYLNGGVYKMMIDTNIIIPITEANKNFSKVDKIADEHRTAIIQENNVPKYLVDSLSEDGKEEIANTQDVFAISVRFIKQNKEAYEVLAK